MNLQAARSILIQDRMDWRKPHLTWVNDRYYRFFGALRAISNVAAFRK
jgi:hypothetical protein